MHRIVINVSFALIALFVAFVEGFVNPFIIWNLVPVIFGYVLLRIALNRTEEGAGRTTPAACYNVIAVGFVLFCHAAWLIDLGGLASGSSTSALIFIYIPVIALIGGAAAYVLGLLAWSIYRKATGT